jgi:glycosyltransferase involved in cell wall biosynthesis
LYRYGLRHSNAIVAQNADQIAACKRAFQRDATLIKSCYLPPYTAGSDPEGKILWVSTMRRLKQPEAFMELARMFPQYQFKMVGGAGAKAEERSYFESLKGQASYLPNLEFAGFIPYAEIDSHFDQASIFINTSEFEGFPNTFLQAWARGIPTVSFLKGKTTQTGHGPDWSVESVEDMAEAVRQLMNSPDIRARRGETCLAHYQAHHSQDAVVNQYRALIANLAQTEAEESGRG